MSTIIQGTDDFKPSYRATAPVPTPPAWWPPIDPATGLADYSYSYTKPADGLLLFCEPMPQARPYDPTKDAQYRRVPLPGTPIDYEPPQVDKGDPLGLDGTTFKVKASNGREYVCIFYRKWFYDEAGRDVPPVIEGTFTLAKVESPAPANAQQIVWPPVSLSDPIAALSGTTFRAKGPNVDQYYGVALLNAKDSVSLDQDVAAIKIWFSLYKVNGVPVTPSSSSSSSSSRPTPPISSSSSSSSTPPKPSSSSSSSSAQATTVVDPIRFFPMYTESKQLQRQVQASQVQIQALVSKINAATSMDGVVALLKDLPQLTNDILSGVTAANNTAANVTALLGDVVPQQQGLVACFYDNTNLKGSPKLRVDPNINFNFGSNPPMAGVPAVFSTRWIGRIKSKVNGAVTFTAASDDGVRVIINDQKIIDDWTSHPVKEFSGTYNMAQGATYDIVVEYMNGGGPGSIVLYWAANGLAKEIVPGANLTTK